MSYASNSSGLLAVATNVVHTGSGRLMSLVLNPAAAGCSVTVYDSSAAASGTVICALVSPASVASTVFHIDSGVAYVNGLVVVVAGAGATAVAHYVLG